MKLDLDLEERNPICKATLERKSGENNILEVKGYIKTISAKINRISIVISDHINKVYAKPNEVFSKIKGTNKRAKD